MNIMVRYSSMILIILLAYFPRESLSAITTSNNNHHDKNAAAMKSHTRMKPKVKPKTLEEIEESLIEVSADVLESLEHEKTLLNKFRLLLISEELRDATNFTNHSKKSTFFWFGMLFCDTIAEYLVSFIGIIVIALYTIKFLTLTKLGRNISITIITSISIGFILKYAIQEGGIPIYMTSKTMDILYFDILTKFYYKLYDMLYHTLSYDILKAFCELLGTLTIFKNAIPLSISVFIKPLPPTKPINDDLINNVDDKIEQDVKNISKNKFKKDKDESKYEKYEKENILTKYSKLLKKHPFLIGVPQHALILSLANLTKQYVIFMTSYETAASLTTPYFIIDFKSIRNAAILGGIAMAPLHYIWFKILNFYIKSSLYKVLIDQFIASWFFNLYVLYVLSILNGESLNITLKTFNVVYISWLWWIPVKSIMFYLIPEHLMLPFQTLGSFGWNVIMFLFLGK